MKKLPTFVCRKSENSELIKCICGRCEADQLRVELAAANAKLSPTGIPYCDNGAIRIAELEARIEELQNEIGGHCADLMGQEHRLGTLYEVWRGKAEKLEAERTETAKVIDDLAHRLTASELARAKAVEALRVFGIALEIKGGSLQRDKFLALIREALAAQPADNSVMDTLRECLDALEDDGERAQRLAAEKLRALIGGGDR